MRNPLVVLVLLVFLVLALIAPFSALAGLMVIILVSALISVFWNLVLVALRGNAHKG